jgi:hypothetical protein
VSGPLASWVSEHSRASNRGRAVLVQLALRARHDGMPTSDVSRAQLEHRTGMGLTNVREGLAEVRRLGEVRVVDQGGGRGRPTRYYIPAPPCPAEAECWDCRTLADVIAKTGRDAPGFESVNDKGNRARERGNRAPQRRNRAHSAHTHGTGDGTPPQGGTVTHPESERPRSRRPAADAAAAPAQVREQPIGPATGAAAARGLSLLAEIRKLDRDAEFNPAIAGFRVSDAWCKRYGGFSGIPLDKAERWLAWAAEQVADEQARMQAASRHRLANPVAVADVLDEPGQERGAAA